MNEGFILVKKNTKRILLQKQNRVSQKVCVSSAPLESGSLQNLQEIFYLFLFSFVPLQLYYFLRGASYQTGLKIEAFIWNFDDSLRSIGAPSWADNMAYWKYGSIYNTLRCIFFKVVNL